MVKRGRKAKHVKDPATGETINGLSKEPKSGRYYATGTKLRFGTDFHQAVMKFRRWQRNQDKIATVPMPHVNPGITQAEADELAARHEAVIRPGEYLQEWPPTNVPEAVIWDWVRDQIYVNPKHASEMTGIKQLAHLTDIRPPEPSLRLDAIGNLYADTKINIKADQRRKVRLVCDEFATRVGLAKTLRDVTQEDVDAYHVWVWRTAKRKNRSPSWINDRFDNIKTGLNFALKKHKDKESVRRVLDYCAIFEKACSNGTDPRPIAKEDFAKLLAKCDEKWTAVLLVALNCAMYPQEVADLRKGEIDLDKRTLVTRRGKTGIIRIAVLWPRTVKALKAYFAAEPHHRDHVFINVNGAPYNANHITRNFRRRRKEAKLSDSVTFDQIRDGSYTAVVEAGHDLQMAKLIAGHGTGIPDHYLKRKPTMVATACRAIERAYFGS